MPREANCFPDTHVQNKEERQRMYKCDIEARSRNICCRGKAVMTVYVVLVTQYSERMRHIVLSSVI
jgi:hypothetical protein